MAGRSLPKLAIVGRPNVGKSTLVNRLAGRKVAIVHDQPGVTRDRKVITAGLGDLEFEVIDTAGFDDDHGTHLEARMRQQTELAILEADVIVFLYDALEGVTPIDQRFSEILRRSDKPLILAANKSEGRRSNAGVQDGFSLALGEPVAISAEHGEGMADLYVACLGALDEWSNKGPDQSDILEEAHRPSSEEGGHDIADEPLHEEGATPEDITLEELERQADSFEALEEPTKDRPIRLAIVGRPNAGKSTLLNQLLKEERVLTGPEAGITRDAIEVGWSWQGRDVRLIDTAGLRKRAKVVDTLEKMSTGDSITSLKFADIILLVMDASEAFEKQDLQIAELAIREGRGVVFVISKWDDVDDKAVLRSILEKRFDSKLNHARGAPLIYLSGLTGRGCSKLMPAIVKTYDDWTAKVKTSDLNEWLRYITAKHPPPSVRGKAIKPKYIAQIKSRPPSFVLMCSRGKFLPKTYIRYLTNELRKAFGFDGVPIRFEIRQGRNPFNEETSKRKQKASIVRAKERKQASKRK